jgi:toxin ParE1/3/4
MRVKWTVRASENLDTILKYIHQDNPMAAQAFLAEALKKIKHLEEFPLMGRAGIVPQTREFVVHKNYIVHYRVKDECVEILRVLHARRKFP